MDIRGKSIILKPLTRELCHEIYKKYVADPMMTDETYEYSVEKVDVYFNERAKDPKRRIFAIIVNEIAIGEVQIKYIDNIIKKGNLGIHLVNDSVKGKGYGTEAEKLMIQYAFEELGLNTMYADAVLRNTRSQHIMRKLGFQYICEDEVFKYYELKKDNWLKEVSEE
ncbi:GNAT family N-acetyltransferase [Clostridium hydrogenum]|uniref:GNAT family N-acetyltransferase n=1 Tax=Clostridium hydrogenum TaxID=2855764 RepID=UPI002E35A028|nr:GNAT family N-acetyltransferase [Clostridium hydrogenum]